MNRLLAVGVLISALAVAGVCSLPPPEANIVGGQEVNIADFPYTVAQYHYNMFQCGGTILSSYWILTAAHCLDIFGLKPENVTFRAFSTSVREGGQVLRAESFKIHPRWNSEWYDYDVAVVRLASPIVGLRRNETTRLVDESFSIDNNETVTVAGWGRMDNRSLPINLLAVDVPVLNYKECEIIYGEEIHENQICAGTPGKDSCNGDSGGPLVYRKDNDVLQIGIVSFGPDQCGKHLGVYAKISDPINRQFIREHTGI